MNGKQAEIRRPSHRSVFMWGRKQRMHRTFRLR